MLKGVSPPPLVPAFLISRFILRLFPRSRAGQSPAKTRQASSPPDSPIRVYSCSFVVKKMAGPALPPEIPSVSIGLPTKALATVGVHHAGVTGPWLPPSIPPARRDVLV